MQNMTMYEPPAWLTLMAWAFVATAVLCAAWIARDLVRRRAGGAAALYVVWVVGALAVGPLALWVYLRHGRASAPSTGDSGAALTGGLAGGAASAVAHVLGVPFVVLTGITIAGLDLWAMILVIGVLAVVLLSLLELSADGRGRLGSALTAAAITVLAFDVGMGAWMVLLHFNALMPAPTDVTFTFLMQLGIVLGFATGYPAVAWLVRRQRTALGQRIAV